MFVMALQHYHNNAGWANDAVSTALALMTTEWLVNDMMRIKIPVWRQSISFFLFLNHNLMTNQVQIHY